MNDNPLCRVVFILFASLSLFLPEVLVAGPKIACKDAEFSFGSVASWQTVEHTFTIENAGDEPLQIGAIRACCGATVTIPEKNIPPGSNSALNVKLSLDGKNGESHKSIYVGSNDPTQPYLQVRLLGQVVSGIRAEPPALELGLVSSNACTTGVVDLVCVSNLELRVTNVICSSSLFALMAETGDVRRLKVYTVPPLPPGVSQGTLSVFTDHPKYPKIEIPVSAIVGSDLVTVPAEIPIAASSAKAFSRHLAIKSRTNKPFKILEVKAPEEGMQVTFKAISTGGYKIELGEILPFAELDGKTIQILTDQPETKLVEVPFRMAKKQE